MQKPVIHSGRISRPLLVLNVIVALVYFSWWFMPVHTGNPLLFYPLFLGECYHVLMALTFWFTLWPTRKVRPPVFKAESSFAPSVDVFITVAGEPQDVVRKTATACANLRYRNHRIYILNDGFVAHKDNWQDIEQLAFDLGINCITRKVSGGAKAGNINNALKQTYGQIVVIFDADMAPYPDFLEKVIPYFEDTRVGFVQTPQYYKNAQLNTTTGGAWEQQELFFGPIMEGKDRVNSAFICGTNVAIRREALAEAGGMCEDNIAEDFLTSTFIHQKGWISYYTKEVFSEGLAPEDLLSYFKQQLRWARGSLEVLFSHNPLFKKNLTLSQKIQYLFSALFYLNGVVVLIDIVMPLIALFWGIKPVATTTTSFALFFVPFMFLNLYTLYLASGGHVTFRAIAFSQGSFIIQLRALIAVLLRQNMAFAVTPKQAQKGSFLFLAYPHIFYILLGIVASGVGIYREGINPSIATNIAWVIFNVILFIPFVQAAYKWGKLL